MDTFVFSFVVPRFATTYTTKILKSMRLGHLHLADHGSTDHGLTDSEFVLLAHMTAEKALQLSKQV